MQYRKRYYLILSNVFKFPICSLHIYRATLPNKAENELWRVKYALQSKDESFSVFSKGTFYKIKNTANRFLPWNRTI